DLVLPVGAPPTVRTAIKPNLKASPHSHPTRVLLQSISGVGVQYPGKGSGLTWRSTAHGANRNRTKPQNQPHSHPTRVLLQSISGVEVQYLVLPVGAPPTVRTAIKPNLKASPHSHPTRVLLQSISGVGVQYPGKGSGLTCRSTAHGANRNRTKPQSQPHSHPTRVLLRWIRGGDVWCRSTAPRCELGRHTLAPGAGAPTINTRIRTRGGCSYNKYANSHPWRLLLQNAKESDAYPSHLLRIIYSVIPFLGALLQQFFFILVHIVFSFLIILCMGTGST